MGDERGREIWRLAHATVATLVQCALICAPFWVLRIDPGPWVVLLLVWAAYSFWDQMHWHLELDADCRAETDA